MEATALRPSPLRPDPLRRPALACGALAAMAVLIAAFAPKAGLPEPAPEVTASASLRFEDAAGGVVLVRDAGSGALLASLGIGEGGFVRTSMRALATERRRRDVSRDEPFLLSRHRDGKLVLADPATGRAISLNAFGHANAGAFAAFVDHGREPR